MRGVYTVQYEITSLAAAKTVLYGVAPSTMVIEILSANLLNGSVTTSEQLRASIQRITSLGTPTATAITSSTVQKSEPGSPTTAMTWKADVTASEPTYDAMPIDEQFFNNLGGYYFDPLPEFRPIIPPSGSFGLRLLNTPTNAFRATVQVIYREIG